MTTQDYWILNNGFIKFITHLKGWEEDDESYDKFYEMYNPEDWGPLNGFEDNRNEVSAVETNCENCGDYMSDVEEEDYLEGCNNICDLCCDSKEDKIEEDTECGRCEKSFRDEDIISLIDNDEYDEDYMCNKCWDTSTEDKLDIKVLGFKTTDRLDGDWNSLLFEIRNQEIIVGI